MKQSCDNRCNGKWAGNVVICRSCRKEADTIASLATKLDAGFKSGSLKVSAGAKPEIATEGKIKIISARKGPNRTESEYGRILELEFCDFSSCEVIYEGITLRLKNGARYTPDWVVMGIFPKPLLVETKNSAYKHASYGRSRIAFSQCRLDWPMFDYRWAEKTKVGWVIK